MDSILHNGNIITMDEKYPKASAVAIKNGRIVAVGSNAEILKYTDKNTKVLDLGMKTVIPGFNDSHLHHVKYGIFSNCCDLSKCSSLQELINVTQKFINNNNIKHGSWVIGTGWNQDLFDVKIYPTKSDLDLISKDHPIVMFRCCSHLLLANSKALELLGIDETTPQVKGGYFDVNLGLFRETAKELVQVSLKSYDVPTLKIIIKRACEDLLKQGITSIHTDDFNMSVDYKRIIQAYSELAQEGSLPVRVTQQCLVVNQEELENFINCNYKDLNINDFYRIGPVKILADGSLGSRSAALRESYKDAPEMKGILIHKEHELNKMVEICHKHDYDVAIHCIGDKSLELAINSINSARKKYSKSLRHGIVHCQITDENLLNKIKNMDLLIYAQPIFLNYDLHIVEDRVGKELASSSYNFGRLVRSGVHLSMGTDSPVEKFNPIDNIYCAVTRKDLNGYPEGGFYPEQCITVEESIKAYTCEPAYSSYEENIKGKIKSGYFADMVVLSDDIYNIDNEKLLDVKIEMTMVDGIIRYKSGKKDKH